ncbi:hypothetical protein, partial [Escherichia coli]|uniref:hypothetical protein n=1 Tax=Escherichia coli TaxID=562 RepID=UPI0028636215|nr:hypothetical protein [Escherichia coli]
RLRFSGPKTSIICSPMTSLKTSIKTITYLSDIGCLEIQGASLVIKTPFDLLKHLAVWQLQVSNKKSKGGPNGERKELSAHPMEL